MNIAGSYDVAFVALSMIIAMSASYTALDLAGRLRHSHGLARWAWLATAALVLGGGAWSMQAVGLLARAGGSDFARADLGLAALSFLTVALAAGIGFYLAGFRGARLPAILAGGLVVGLGIVAMHLIGVGAANGVALSDMPGFRGSSARLAFAAALACGTSIVALLLTFRSRSFGRGLVAAGLLGTGIAGLHGLDLVPRGSAALLQAPLADNLHLLLAVAAAFLTLCAALVAALADLRHAAFDAREAAVRGASEERYRLLYRHTPLPLHSLNAEARIDQVSDRWLSLLGYERSEVIGRPLTDFMTSQSAQRRKEEHWPQLQQIGELRDAEYELVTKDGRTLQCVLSAVAERDGEGRILRTLCGLVDITARRQAEDALRQAQKLEAVGQLTGGIAHDFNNLLAVILGNLELARKRAPDDPRLTRLIDNTIQGAQRGAALTQRMLAFARRQDLKPEAVNVPELVMGMTELLRRSIGPTVRIETRFPLGLPPARVDANQLELALLNLAVNARDAMPNGGTIIIGAREEWGNAEGKTDAPPAERSICLAVTDTGSGMDEETLARATEPFFTTKGVGKGTGLGLAMVHGLAAQSGGRLLLRSRPGEGTIAEIHLPIAKTPAAVAPVPETEIMDQTSRARSILVVDDDPLVLMATSAMLEDLGYLVTEASSGLQALELVDANPEIDLVLTDQAMPGMSGVQLAATLKARRPNLPVILGTGYAELPEGSDPTLVRLGKPFDREALERAIQKTRHDNVVSLSSRQG